MKKKRAWLCVIIFFILAVCITVFVCSPYSYPKSYVSKNLAAYYDEEENTVDGVLVGTSVVAYSWQPTVAYEKYGTAIYQAGSSIQAFGVLPEYIDALSETQDLKYVVIDIHGLRSSAVKVSVYPNNLRRLYNDMAAGKGKWKVLNASLDYAERVYEYYGKPDDESLVVDRSDISWYIPFFDFHNRWKDGLTKNDFDLDPNPYKGALTSSIAFKTRDNSDVLKYYDDDGDEYSLNEFQLSELKRLFDYIEEKELPVLFICMPSFNSAEDERELRAIAKYVEAQGYPMLDFGSREMLTETGIDVETDFCNIGHLNSKGGRKITEYIAGYIAENYYYVDHRGDEAYASWEKAAKSYNKFYKNKWKDADDD